jgi:hypothetical protein
MIANTFALKGPGVEVDYKVGVTPGIPALIYKAGAFQKSFTSAQVLSNDAGLGQLIVVHLFLSVDAGGERFGFFLPQIDVVEGSIAQFYTVGVYETFTGPDTVPHRPSAWRCIELAGTAQYTITPL